MKGRILLIYTGGTIGMWCDPRTGVLRPMDLALLAEQVPELQRVEVELGTISFEKPIDSSDMRPQDWLRIARIIAAHHAEYDGFVVLHGSDTMAYTASALSFLLEGLDKPVVLTGSQLPVGMIRTDARENLVTAIEIAAARDPDGSPMVPEVCIYFEYRLMRGNRTVKVHAERFEAFRSPNCPPLAEAGIHLRYDRSTILPRRSGGLRLHEGLDDRVALIHLYPGMRAAWLEAALAQADLQAAVLATFGSGNCPTDAVFLKVLRDAVDRGVLLVNVTQCVGGRVEQGRYVTSRALQEMGVVPGADLTIEAAITKLMVLLGRKNASAAELAGGTGGVAQGLVAPICGELTLA
jgi:L-asparaginase